MVITSQAMRRKQKHKKMKIKCGGKKKKSRKILKAIRRCNSKDGGTEETSRHARSGICAPLYTETRQNRKPRSFGFTKI